MRMIAFLLALAFAGAAFAQLAPSGPDFARFEAAVAAAYARDPNGGVSIGMVRDGRLAASRSFGLADTASRRAADSRTIYRVGSVTKAFTALMLLQLVEDGTVRLTDPVERYLPEVRQIRERPEGAPPITLIQLATHTAGLAAEPEGEGFDQGPVSSWEERLLAALPATRFVHEPGTRYAYSNIGYAILGAALSRAAGRSYVDHVRERITGPLGMADTGFTLNAAQQRRLATGYMVENGEASAAEAAAGHAGRGYKVPVGGLYTTLEDMAKFVAFQMGRGPAEVLRPESLEAASRGLITVDRGMGEAYGLGFQLFTNGDVVLQGHGGGMPGYRALQVFEREAATGFILLRNAVGGRFGDPVFMVFSAFPD